MNTNTNEIIQIHIGHAGIQIANPCWDIYRHQHNIDAEGKINDENREDNAFFSCEDNGFIQARTILLDTEDTAFEVFRNGRHKSIFNQESLISGKMDTGGLYPNGYLPKRLCFTYRMMEAIRAEAEKCSNLQGFMVFRGLGGGTGSGFGTKLCQYLKDCFPKRPLFEFNIFPSSNMSLSVVEPFNTILAAHAGIDLSDCNVLIENDRLYNIASKKLEILSPTFNTINKLIALIITNFTSTLRCQYSLNFRLPDYINYLVPLEKRLHFPIINHAPFLARQCLTKDQLKIPNIVKTLFEPDNQVMSFNPLNAKSLSSIFLYHGDITYEHAVECIENSQLEMPIHFVHDKRSKYEISINPQTPTKPPFDMDIPMAPITVTSLSNNTGVHNVWTNIIDQYKQMEQKSACFHHFLKKGVTKDIFKTAVNDLNDLIAQYAQI